MQHGNPFVLGSKPRAALPSNPQGQRDFRHQNDRSLSARQGFLHASQINFRLSAARYPVKQLHAEFAQLKARANTLHRALLLVVQSVSSRRVSDVKWIFRGIDGLFPALQQAIREHALDHAPRNLGELQQLRHRQRPAFRFQQGPYFLFFFLKRSFGLVRKSLPSHDRLRFSFAVL
jgi:hypothetical protein